MNASNGLERSLLFLLVPDVSAARRVRRMLVDPARETDARSGVVVGSWPELVEWARRAYLVAAPWADEFEIRLDSVLRQLTDAFWTASLSVAPVETREAVSAALMRIVSATDPGADLGTLEFKALAERPRRHVGDVVRLVQALDGALPDELAVIRRLLAADGRAALRGLRVLQVEGVPALSRWQTALVDKLNRDVGADAPGTAVERRLRDVLGTALGDRGTPVARGALGVLQSRLYRPGKSPAALDDSVQWLGVRDFLQEAEVAAGMVQALLAAEPDLKPSDIGLLLPDRFEYALAVEDAFRLGGIALSGLPVERWRRDMGREAVFHFLYCRQKPAPAMALAVCLSSPLMPWSREMGAELAQAVMSGNYELRPPKGASRPACTMLDLLREGDSEPASLRQAVQAFVELLTGEAPLVGHVEQAIAAAGSLQVLLTGAVEIDWTALRRAVIPRLLTAGETPEFTLEGVTVWRESQEPWRAVRRLIVLGFAQGRYPADLGSNAVFVASDLEAIRDLAGLPVRCVADELEQRRSRFCRQLGAASASVTLLVPRRDFAGVAQAPSESLVFMHQLFQGPETPDGLVAELDAAEERAQARHLAVAAPAVPTPPRALVVEDLEFERDLLGLRTDKDGKPRPESPSSLETLMVSRLAWLLHGLKAEPLAWAPESADPLVMGSLAHAVFEGLFYRGAALSKREEIPPKVEALVDAEVRRIAPFLRSAQWKVERRNFLTETIKAAVAWRDALEGLGAEVLAHEEWLQGTWCGIPVHGQTDLILGLPGDRLLVVDYKRSKSRKRVEQMLKGYDSQASLYRAMLATGGPKNPTDPALAARLRGSAKTGVVYYMLNDQVALSDTAIPDAGAVPGWRTLETDIAGQALGLIEQFIGEVRSGEVRLNREGDEDFFKKKAGLTPYALEKSPLIAIFRLSAEADDAP